jgi:8-oxo-dGTP pyrophosphatase MutT (NUDIX family)
VTSAADLRPLLLSPEAAAALDAPGTKDAAVLVPLYLDSGALHAVFTKRRDDLKRHAGEISFPGGRQDFPDEDLRTTALREAEEEIGLAGDRVELLTALPVVETQTTGFRIAPFLARLPTPPPSWRPQEREVAEVVELRVADLARPEVGAEEVREFPTWPAPRRIRLWRVGRYEVWGVTYRILEPLVPRLLAGEWPL